VTVKELWEKTCGRSNNAANAIMAISSLLGIRSEFTRIGLQLKRGTSLVLSIRQRAMFTQKGRVVLGPRVLRLSRSLRLLGAQVLSVEES
jgi:hypothetical protein